MSKEQKNVKVNPELIHLTSVRLIKGSIDTDPQVSSPKISSFDTSFEVNHAIDEANELIRFIIGVKIEAVDEDLNTIGITAEYTTEYIFKIEKLSDWIIDRNTEINSITVNHLLTGTLMSIAYSTTRGIVLTRTQGTICDGVILPIIDPYKLLIGDKTEPPKTTI